MSISVQQVSRKNSVSGRISPDVKQKEESKSLNLLIQRQSKEIETFHKQIKQLKDNNSRLEDENKRLLQSDYEKRYFDLVIQKESLKSQFELTNKKLVKALSYNKL